MHGEQSPKRKPLRFNENRLSLELGKGGLPPTAGGLGEERFEEAMGTSPGGFRPVEEAIINNGETSET